MIQVPIMDGIATFTGEDSRWLVFAWEVRVEWPWIHAEDAVWLPVEPGVMTERTFPG